MKTSLRAASRRTSLAALLGRQIDPDRLLPPVRILEVHVDAVVGRVQPEGDEPAVGVAGHGVFDLDDLGPPLGQDRACHGHEDVRRDLEHTDAGHRSSHEWFRVCAGSTR